MRPRRIRRGWARSFGGCPADESPHDGFNEAPANSPGLACSGLERGQLHWGADMASMRPRRIRRGWAAPAVHITRRHDVRCLAASMRPRRIRRGWDRPTCHADRSSRFSCSFNEAPANSPGLGATGIELKLPAVPEPTRFNEAPANSPGLGHSHTDSTSNQPGPDASMRPRRIRRGWGS